VRFVLKITILSIYEGGTITNPYTHGSYYSSHSDFRMSSYNGSDLSRASSVQRIDDLDLNSSLFEPELDALVYGFK
jgi:hypothetical protein